MDGVSLEYCEKYNPQSIYDFSFKEKFEQLAPGTIDIVQCSGLGNVAISKDAHGNRFIVYYISSHLTGISNDFFYPVPYLAFLQQDPKEPLFGEVYEIK